MPEEHGRLFARGIWDGDAMPTLDLGNGVTAPAVTLNLERMQLGLSPDTKPSWAEQVLELRDRTELGVFRLGYLEAVLRAADREASRKEGDCA